MLDPATWRGFSDTGRNNMTNDFWEGFEKRAAGFAGMAQKGKDLLQKGKTLLGRKLLDKKPLIPKTFSEKAKYLAQEHPMATAGIAAAGAGAAGYGLGRATAPSQAQQQQ
jgi:hypothetical protein